MNGQKNLIRRNKPIKPNITTNWCISNVFSVEFQANEYNDAQLLLQLPKDFILIYRRPWLINLTSRFWSITFIFRFYDVKRPTKKGMKKCPYLLLRKSGTMTSLMTSLLFRDHKDTQLHSRSMKMIHTSSQDLLLFFDITKDLFWRNRFTSTKHMTITKSVFDKLSADYFVELEPS